jgi:murein DD-endopeptidase MepM/ murein hydrolase activator NlpD
MCVSVMNFRSKILLRGVALGLMASLGVGCSSDFARFAPTGSDYTGSINQRQIIHKQNPPVRQSFPDQASTVNMQSENQSLYNEPVYTGSVQSNGTIRPVVSEAKSSIKRKALGPVSVAGTAVMAATSKFKSPISAARSAVTAQEFPAETVAAKAQQMTGPIDRTVTGAVTKAAPVIAVIKEPGLIATKASAVALKNKAALSGWSAVSGTALKVRDGETISHLSTRFGVPAAAILAANGLSSAADLKSGRSIIIPVFNAPNTGRVAAISATKETEIVKPTPAKILEANEEKLPMPKQSPVRENVAVLPVVPQVRAKQRIETTSASNVDRPGFKVIANKTQAVAEVQEPQVAPIKIATSNQIKASNGRYAVSSGDSLYTIAKRNGTTVASLKAANGLADGKLKIGQELKMPTPGAFLASAKPVQELDPITTGSSITTPKKQVVAKAPAQKAPVDAKASVETKAPYKIETAAVKPAAPSNAVIEEAEKDTAAAPGSTGISKLRWPVRGRTLVGYGQAGGGKANDGIDISVPNGTPVKSAENGVVIYAGTGLKDFGNTVLVRHDNGLVTVYGNNGNILVRRGQTVKRGQELAKSGMSGSTKVPQLHFEVRKNSSPVNPATLLE